MATEHRVIASRSAVVAAVSLLVTDVKAQWNDEATKLDCMKSDCTEVDREILALEQSLELVQKEINIQLAFHRAQRNSLVSLPLRLPDEILSQVFLWLVKRKIPKELAMLCKISLVCARWHRVVESTPGLWAYITSDRALSKTSMQLVKSKNAALSISLSTTTPPDLELFRLIESHANRWETVDLFAADGWCDYYTPAPAPMLEKFVFSCRSPEHQIDLFQGHAPRLRHLDICGLPISWSSNILTGLLFLHICAFDGQSIPSTEEFCKVLMACTELKTLHIEGASEFICTPSDEREFQLDIHMPALDTMLLSFLHPVTVQSIVSSIRTSTKCHTVVTLPACSGTEDDQCILQVSSALLECSLLSGILKCPQTIKLDDHVIIALHAVDITTEDPDRTVEKLDYNFPKSISAFTVYNIVVPISNRVSITSIELSYIEDAMASSSISLREVFQDLIGLRELSLRGFVHSCPFEDLSIPSVVSRPNEGDVANAWLCPLLESLTVREITFTVAQLTNLINLRYVQGILSSGHSKASAMLKHLSVYDARGCSLDDMTGELALMIVDVLGRESFLWDKKRLNGEGKWILNLIEQWMDDMELSGSLDEIPDDNTESDDVVSLRYILT